MTTEIREAAPADAAAEPLTPQQRAEVGRHLRLVQLQMERQAGVSLGCVPDRDRDDLFQEGCLALARAVRTYDAARHGDFAPYALARIHHALSELLFERTSNVRVPAKVQRRRRQADAVRHDPRGASRGDSTDDDCSSRGRVAPHLDSPDELADSADDPTESLRHAPRAIHHDFADYVPRLQPGKSVAPEAACGTPLRHLAHERYETLARHVAADLAADPHGRQDRARLVAACLEERWLIAQPEMRTPLRDLAERLACSLGRLSHFDEAFQGGLARALRNDPAAQWLADRAAAEPAGLNTAIEPEELRTYRAVAETCLSSA